MRSRAERSITAVVTVLTLGVSSALSAQGPSPVLSRALARPAPMTAPTIASLPDTARRYPATYWKEGLFIAGGTMAVLGGIVGAAFCTSSDVEGPSCPVVTVGTAALAGTVGGSVGALIGGLFPKPPRDSASVR